MNRLHLLLLGACLAFALAACTTSPVDVPEKVPVEVPVACIKPADLPARPYLRSADDLLAMDGYRRTLATWSEFLKLQGYAAELEAVVTGCSRIPAQAPP